MSNKINLSIVEDHEDMRDFLKIIFSESEEFNFIQAYKSAEEAITFLPQSNVQIVIVDIGLPGESGIECVRRVKELRPDMLFVMFTIFDKNNNIFESLKAGANGYLLKSTDKEEILSGVKELVEGGAPMSPSIARKVTDFFFNKMEFNQEFQELKLLGPREKEVLDSLSKGLLYKEISSKMNITIGTVKQHIHSIYKKLHVQNRTEAINKYLGRKV